jgi:serine-type D-Ala-D-Ala carboxypeptidase/endopeptidase (penicillin-binding protein 4)
MGMRVDLVAGPIRYPRTPLLALLLVAVLPVAGLATVALWSDTRADEYEATDEPDATATSLPTTEPGPPSPALVTAMLSYRRTPAEVLAEANADRLAEQVDPVYGFLDQRSCSAVSVDGRPVTGVNQTSAVIPASNQKLITAAVALDVLGPEHRFTTSVSGTRPVDGTIDGDVYLIGGGDPVLTADDFPIDDDNLPAFNVTSLDELADTLVAAGVERIAGAVVGDGTRYDDEFAVDSWADGIAGVDAGPYDALLVNDSRTLGRASRQADPNEAAAREMVRLLGERGVAVGAGWSSGAADPSAIELGSVRSAPLDDIVAEMLTTSDNNTAEMLLKEIGVADSGAGTRAAGLAAVDRTLRGWGVPMVGVEPIDGSGLSADNRLTCAALISVLQRSAGGPLQDGLAVAGRTGTLAGEFVGTSVEGRLVAKTGTLDNPPVASDPPAVKALAGYLPASNGEVVEFVFILNSPDITTDRKFEPLWIALAERLDSYPAGPDPADLGPR